MERAALPANGSFLQLKFGAGTLKTSRMPHEKGQGAAFSLDSSSHTWLGAAGLAIAVGIAYFVAARLGLVLRVEGVAVFWPAAGIAVGALITLGPSARFPVAGAVAVATIASNLMIARNPWLAIAFGVVNAGQALFTAWLIERWFGSVFTLEDVPQVLGFLVASAAGAAIAGVGAAVAVSLVQSNASLLNVWRLWFAACSLGIVTVAPLLIGLGGVVRELPPRRELFEGTVGLVALAVLSTFVISLPEGPWATALPVALVFPILLWIAVRCRPVFAAAAASIVAQAVIWSTTFNMGHFGDASIPLAERILAAQTLALAGSLLAFLLAALFAERRQNESTLKMSNERLKDSNDRLQLALDAAELGVWSIDPKNGRFENDARDRQIHRHHPQAPPKTLAEARPLVHPDDLPSLDAVFGASGRAGGSCKTEYRLAPIPGHAPADDERWIAVEGTVVRRADGRPERLLGVTRDITERKRTEEKLRKSERKLRELLGALPAAIHTTDTAGRITFCNKAAVDLWGVSPELGKDKCSDLGRLYYPDGTLMPVDVCPTKLCLMERRAVPGREALFERPDGRRIPIIPYPAPLTDEEGEVVGVVSMKLDISERKKAELALAERNIQLALAGKAALVGSFAYDTDTEIMQISEGYAAIHGFPEGTVEKARSECLADVHSDDIGQVAQLRSEAFRDRRCEYSVEYRIIRAGGGEVRWVETRCFISYGCEGRPHRVVGVSIDITERKRVEEQQRKLVAELDHRVKNVLATVQAVATHTMDATSSIEHFVAALDGRLRSMGSTHEILSHRRWLGVPLAELVQRELAPYATGSNAEIGGPEVMLSAEAGQTMGMVLHELVTNAAKYGALSIPSGRVSIRWRLPPSGSASGRLVFTWRETGGPLVQSQSKPSYGMHIVRELVPYELGGTVDYALSPKGAQCQMDIPLAQLSCGSSHGNGSASAYPSLPADDFGKARAG